MPNPRKPRKLKEIAGTIQKCRDLPDQPEPETGVPECPDHIRDEARNEWDRVTKDLKDMDLLSVVDRAAIAGYCINYQRWVKAEEFVREKGILVRGKGGIPVKNPAVAVACEAMKLMLKFLTEFGLTPASRTKVSTSKSKKKQSIWSK